MEPLALMVLLAAGGACRPDLVDATGTVDTPRVLAIRSEPAEAAPGQPVTLTALYGDRTGTLDAAPLDWAFCIDRKPLAELGPMSSRCLAPAGDALVGLGTGATALGAIPRDACRLFGPDRPDPKPGEPAGRPVDPDTTGGFYQPLRVRVPLENDAYAAFGVRLACSLGGATQEQRAEFERSYVRNTNPAIARLTRVRDGAEDEIAPQPSATPLDVRASESVALRLAWAPCPDAGACAGAERYVAFEPVGRTLVTRREALRVAWFATSGVLAEERTGRGEDEADVTASDNHWTAPSAFGDVTLWAVLRDDRGGVGFQSYRVRVSP